MALTHQQIIEDGWRQILFAMDMGDVTPEERQNRIEAGVQALRTGSEVKGKVNGKIVVLNKQWNVGEVNSL